MYLIIKGCNSRTIRWKRGVEQGMWGWMWSLSPLDLPFSEDFCVFVVVQSLGRVQLIVTPCTVARQVSLSIKSVMPSNHLILCHPLLPPSIFPSIRVFSSEFFASTGQSIGDSASASVLPMNTQD